ncbi:Outer membrane protein beta-barrel domain-containing protein [Cyclonatronum proteinivorum]|uniref:Outer membrane protein beta-barrel domain-containing protein n=1 Tax=Cyclonatronum proteinivorum TaxID=1457365 RepID=A0A345UFZ1_9BACT|nr:porin family protein [Cyclonatronum proteinivorum]AXI99392.1 Outer membrane protein beta-barrel domain-containing protein [Cyclonatronum proteinivorum]
MNGSFTNIPSALIVLIVCSTIHLIFPPADIAAQQNAAYTSGFLITTEADTLRGDVRLADDYDHSWRVQFRAEGASGFQVYRPESVFAYGTDGGFTWYAVQGNFEGEGVQTVFMREDITASLTLYSTQLTRERTDFFVRSEDGRLIYLEPGFYIMLLESLFGDCGVSLRNHDRAARRYRYTRSGMARVFETYLSCRNETDTAVWHKERYEPETRNFRWGVMAGFNMSNSRITAYSTNLYAGVAFDYVPGFSAGLFAEIPLPPQGLSFRPELFFTTRGGEAEIPFPLPNPPELPLTDDKLTTSFSYVMLNLPLMRETEMFGLRPFVQGGVMLGMLVGRDTKASRFVLTDEGERELRENGIIQFYKELSTGVNLGTGLRVPISEQQSLLIEARYTRIFSNLDDGVEGFRNTALELMLGFSF